MTGRACPKTSLRPAAVRRYGPEVGEPPLLVDPRRWGSLIGLLERMFFWLGGLVSGLGATGLLAGALGGAHAAEALAVLAGLVMLIVITAYARGRFAPALPDSGSDDQGAGTSRSGQLR